MNYGHLKNLNQYKRFYQSKKGRKDKRKKNSHQNYLFFKNITQENSTLKFGEISKIISSQWNNMTTEEKKTYESKEEDIMSNYTHNDNSNESYIHLFDNTNDEEEINLNRIDFEEDEDEIEIDDCDDDYYDLNLMILNKK